jgi:hypothetical protein
LCCTNICLRLTLTDGLVPFTLVKFNPEFVANVGNVVNAATITSAETRCSEYMMFIMEYVVLFSKV